MTETLNLPNYVVITPARDEAQFIELTIESVLAQTVRPTKWVIVSDGSTDGTDEIVAKYAAEHPWIELIRIPDRRERHFAGKVYAFNAGYDRVKSLDYQAIASMDADISFGADHFSFLLSKLAEDPTLGLVGTPFEEGAGQVYDYRFVSIEHVSGHCQLFRRECFEDIGGYQPVRGGGIDLIAVVAARMKGWKTRTFTQRVCFHHRQIGTALEGGLAAANFRQGVKDYACGGHPVWELCRVMYQMSKPPFVLGGLALGIGYLSGLVLRKKRPISHEMVSFRQHEQMRRLRAFFSKEAYHRRRLTDWP